MRILKNLLVVGLVGGVVMLLMSLIGKGNPLAAAGKVVGKVVDDTINKPQPGTALDNMTPGSWQDFWSFPYRVANALGLMPDLPKLDPSGGITVPPPDPTGSIPDARLYPGDGGSANA